MPSEEVSFLRPVDHPNMIVITIVLKIESKLKEFFLVFSYTD